MVITYEGLRSDVSIPGLRSCDMHVSGRWLFFRHDEPDAEETWYRLGDDVFYAEWQPEHELRAETEAERAWARRYPSTPSDQGGPVV